MENSDALGHHLYSAYLSRCCVGGIFLGLEGAKQQNKVGDHETLVLKCPGSHSGKGHHYYGRHLSRTMKLHECRLPLTQRPYMSSLSSWPPLHVARDVTPLLTDLGNAHHSATLLRREVHKHKLPIKDKKLSKLELQSNQQTDWSLVTTITITQHQQPTHIHHG